MWGFDFGTFVPSLDDNWLIFVGLFDYIDLGEQSRLIGAAKITVSGRTIA
jgi:hypothetical protein